MMTQLQVKAFSAFTSFRDREEGQAIVEYALILVLVSVAGVALLSTLGGTVSGVFSKVNADFKI